VKSESAALNPAPRAALILPTKRIAERYASGETWLS
jgi:hypothetical protein